MASMNYERMIHCPCCGAPVTGNACEYCGCVIYDFADINLDGKASYVRIKTDQGIFCAKVMASPETSINVYTESVDFTDFFGREVETVTKNISCQITLTLDCVLDNGKLFEFVQADKPYRTVYDDWG